MMGEVSPGKHVSPIGEDISRGTIVLSKGRTLRPQDLGVLSSIGVSEVPVVRQPRVHLVLTGDELLPAGTMPSDFRIADANGPMLHALVARDGGTLQGHLTIVEDNPAAILQAMQTPADVTLVSGGTSVGPEDHAPVLLAEHGELAIHGIAMRPSSPTGLGRIGESIVVLLPGNPVSCLCAYDFFAGRAIRSLSGRAADWPYRSQMLPLSRKLVSVVGRVDYARMRITGDHVEPMAVAGASILSSTTRSDGFCIVSADSEGLPEGALVQFYYYDH
jgi:molybdopterin molybdotransferase